MRGVAASLLLSACALALGCSSSEEAAPKDAGADVDSSIPRLHDAGAADTGPPAYVPQGVRCTRPTNAQPPPKWVEPSLDAGPSGEAGLDASDDGGATDAGPPLLLPPRVRASHGVIAPLPVIVPVTFDGDDLRDEIEDFSASVGCTTYWRSILSDYGIGDAIMGAPVHLSEAPPTSTTDDEIQAWLASKLSSDPSFPPPDVNVVYAIYYPQGTSITYGGGKSCFNFGAYHGAALFHGGYAPYAVMPRCPGGLGTLTASASHELIEYASDPTLGGYFELDDRDVAWGVLGGSEIGDMCEHSGANFFKPTDYPFVVQRGWSNHRAFQGDDPCQPASGPSYFVAAPAFVDPIVVSWYGAPRTAIGVKVAVGDSAKVPVYMLGNGAPGTWTVSVEDLGPQFGMPATLHFALDKNTGTVGDVLTLTVQRVGTNMLGAEPLLIHSKSGGAEHLWFGVAGD